MASTLNGRIARLEAAMVPDLDRCRGCGLRHIQPLTIALLRSVLRVVGGTGDGLEARTPLCLCDGCCGALRDRWFAQRSHGMSTDEGTA